VHVDLIRQQFDATEDGSNVFGNSNPSAFDVYLILLDASLTELVAVRITMIRPSNFLPMKDEMRPLYAIA
jgi:hypothetical protein